MPQWEYSYLESRFWSKVNKTDFCWEWKAFKMSNGYGMFGRHMAGVHSQLAHRWSWEFTNQQAVPANMFVLHKCDNPGCVRPDHLFLGSQSDNMQDMSRKNRHHNSLKTHCPKGHEYNLGNTFHFPKPNGGLQRACKTCRNDKSREYMRRMRAAL